MHFGRCDVSLFQNIIDLAAGSDHTLGLRADGTVLAVGDDSIDQLNVGGRQGIGLSD